MIGPFLVRTFKLTVSLEFESDLPASLLLNLSSVVVCFSVVEPQFKSSVLQTPFLMKARCYWPLLLCGQSKRARMNYNGPPVKALPESFRERPTPHQNVCKAGTRKHTVANQADMARPSKGTAS